jgi:hypothetical protein
MQSAANDAVIHLELASIGDKSLMKNILDAVGITET